MAFALSVDIPIIYESSLNQYSTVFGDSEKSFDKKEYSSPKFSFTYLSALFAKCFILANILLRTCENTTDVMIITVLSSGSSEILVTK